MLGREMERVRGAILVAGEKVVIRVPLGIFIPAFGVPCLGEDSLQLTASTRVIMSAPSGLRCHLLSLLGKTGAMEVVVGRTPSHFLHWYAASVPCR